MKNISAFDILGPIMIGPSSSHTAGALKIAEFVHKLADSKITNVTFTVYESFAHTYQGHGTDKALVSGILGFKTDDFRIKQAFEFAQKEGLTFDFIVDKKTKTNHPNTVLINATTEKKQKITVIGESIGGADFKIVHINGIDVDFSGAYHTIIIEQKDEKGVIANIAQTLSRNDINIAFMRVFRHEKGGVAYTVIETDEDLPITISSILLAIPCVLNVSIINI